MRKVFKGLSILVAATAMCGGIAMATACNGGYNGEYNGEYHYKNSYGVEYGMKVKVTVENNIITKVEDVTDGAYVTVSEGWVNYYVTNWKNDNKLGAVVPAYDQYGAVTKESAAEIAGVYHEWYAWENKNQENWTNNEAWLLQQYEGMAVSDVLAIKVFVKDTGEPYEINDKQNSTELRNPGLKESGLLISGATQGSGRVLLAVQDALKNK